MWPLTKGTTHAAPLGRDSVVRQPLHRDHARARRRTRRWRPTACSRPPTSSTPVEFDSLINTFNPSTRAGLKSFLQNAGITLRTASPNLARAIEAAPAALAQTSAVLGDLDTNESALNTLVRSGAQVVDAVNDADPGIQPLITNAATTFAALAEPRHAARVDIADGPVHARSGPRDARPGRADARARADRDRPDRARRHPGRADRTAARRSARDAQARRSRRDHRAQHGPPGDAVAEPAARQGARGATADLVDRPPERDLAPVRAARTRRTSSDSRPTGPTSSPPSTARTTTSARRCRRWFRRRSTTRSTTRRRWRRCSRGSPTCSRRHRDSPPASRWFLSQCNEGPSTLNANYDPENNARRPSCRRRTRPPISSAGARSDDRSARYGRVAAADRAVAVVVIVLGWRRAASRT